MTYVVSSDVWKPVIGKYVVSGGAWRPVIASYVVSSGVWKPTYTSGGGTSTIPSIDAFSTMPDPASPWSRILVTMHVKNLLASDKLILSWTDGHDDKYKSFSPSTTRFVDADARFGVEYVYTLTYLRGGVVRTFPASPGGRKDKSTTRLLRIPAPVLKVSGITSHTARLDWTPGPGTVTRITRYTPGSNELIGSWDDTDSTHSFAGKLEANTRYSYTVRRRLGIFLSPHSNKVTFRTSPSTYAGTHRIATTQSYTFWPDHGSKYDDPDQNWHGTPSKKSSMKHTRFITVFHYHTTSSSSDPFSNIRKGLKDGLKITRARVYLARGAAGQSIPIKPFMSTVRHKRKPNSFADLRLYGTRRSNDGIDEYGKNAEWVNIPMLVAAELIRSAGRGLALGDTTTSWTSWMNFEKNNAVVGRVEIVLG